MFKDQFLHFTYNGKHSSEFDVFYEGDGDNFVFAFAQKRAQVTSSPMYQERKFWLGAELESKSFSMTLILPYKSMDNIEDVLEWLNPGKPGWLTLDTNPNYKYEVTIAKMGDITMYPYQEDNGLIRTISKMDITFETIGAHKGVTEDYVFNVKDTTLVAYEPDHLLPFALGRAGGLDFINWMDSSIFLKATTGTPSFSLSTNRAETGTIFSAAGLTQVPATYSSQLGIAYSAGGLVNITSPAAAITSEGPYGIKPSSVFSGSRFIRQSLPNLAVSTSGMDLKGYKEFIVAKVDIIDENTPLVEVTKQDNLGQKNVIKNGNFVTNTAGWTALNSAGLTLAAEQGTLALSRTAAGKASVTTESITNNDIYYYRMMAKSTTRKEIQIGIGGTLSNKKTINSEWSEVSMVGKKSTRNGFEFIAEIANNSEKIQIKNAIAINLTKTYGEGNEPSLTEANAWFDNLQTDYFQEISPLGLGGGVFAVGRYPGVRQGGAAVPKPKYFKGTLSPDGSLILIKTTPELQVGESYNLMIAGVEKINLVNIDSVTLRLEKEN